MEALTNFTSAVNGIVWGPPMLIAILAVGIVLTVGLGFMQFRKLGTAFGLLFQGRKPKDSDGEGEISPFQALMTALSATVGTGNIAGVATAIFLGGPGALFWMWCTALVGMATKYAEAVCAVKYREVDANGNHIGGPMYYIKNGLGKNWYILAIMFAFFGAVAGFGIGNTVQANSVAHALEANFSIPTWLSGLVMFVLVGAVLLGGIRRIGAVAEILLPAAGIFYVVVGLVVVFMNIGELPAAVGLIFTSAFTGSAAAGGFAGATVMMAIRYGVARGVFSNEAGLGSAAIAHAAAKTNNPVRQGMIGMLGTFIDTILVCSITGLAIIMSGAWTSGETGAALTSLAFSNTLGPVGGMLVAIALSLFAFTTILGWSFYSEKCVGFFFGTKAEMPFRILWVLVIPIGAMGDLGYIWLLADTLNALMALPNLIALLVLSPVIFKVTKEYFASN